MNKALEYLNSQKAEIETMDLSATKIHYVQKVVEELVQIN